MRRVLILVLVSVLSGWVTSADAADNLTVLDGNRVERVLATDDDAGVHTYKMRITNTDGEVINFSDHGSIGVTPHEHSSHGNVHLMPSNISANVDYILVDLSDTTHWPHTDTTALHLEFLDMQVDASSTAAWEIHLVWLDNCSVASCDSYPVFGASGNKTTGNNLETQIAWQQAGPILKPGFPAFLSSHTILGDTTYQTDVPLRSAYIIGSASTFPGSGDLLLQVVVTAGSINIHCNLAYHTHNALHP